MRRLVSCEKDYRRLLTAAESKELWAKLRERWGVRGIGYPWYPLSADPAPAGAIAVHTELWDSREGDDLLRRVLADCQVRTCYELREGPPEYELDASMAPADYDGRELFLTSDFEWLLYASHERSIALAGWIAEFFAGEWPDLVNLQYRGRYHTKDLRGTDNPEEIDPQ